VAKIALLIGVGEYGVGLNALPGAVKDVEAMQRVLQHPEMGQFDHIKTLTNPDPLVMQGEIETLCADRSKDDLILLFFSGHGVKDDSNRLYFATTITRKTTQGELVKSTAVPAGFVNDVMRNSRSKRQVVLLDCCFSGAFAEDMRAKDDGSVDVQTQLGGEGRAVLTSSSSTQYSFEQQGSDLSVYTRFLVEGMETGAADLDGNGVISIDELHDYASRKVQESAPAMKPKIYAVEEGFKIRLAKAPVGDPKLSYRKEVERFASRGEISDIARYTLNTRQNQLRIAPAEAQEIETQVLKPYQEYKQKLQQYEEVLAKALERENNSLVDYTRQELKRFQEVLGLEDKDVESIEAKLCLPREEASPPQVSKTTSPPVQPQYREEKIDQPQNAARTPTDSTQSHQSSNTSPPRVQPQHQVEVPAQSESSRPVTPPIQAERARTNRILWFQWVLATAVGEAVTNIMISHYISGGTSNFLAAMAGSAAVGGAIFGVLQGFILRRYLSKTRWLLASTLGYAMAGAIGGIGTVTGLAFGLIFGTISGVVLGIAQWLILRQHFSKAGWWVLGSAVGWSMCWSLESIGLIPSWAVGGFVGGIVAGAITGGVMIWLVRHPITGKSSVQ
jgi:hypothetical protein